MDRPGSGAAPPVRLIVTEDAPSYGVLAALRGLRARGFEPWLAVTSSRRSYGSRSRAAAGIFDVPDPRVDRDDYVQAIAGMAARLGARAVLPGTELALRSLTGSDDVMPAGTVVGVPDPETVRVATDKRELARLARTAGLEVPETVFVPPGASVDGIPLRFPVIVKTVNPDPARTAARVAPVRVAGDRAALERAMAQSPGEGWLVQRWIDGELQAVSGVAWRGRLCCAVHQRSERIYPRPCGISAFATTVSRQPGLEQRVSRLLENVGWSGVFQVQFLADGPVRYLVDLNPRVYGSMGLAVAAGANLPAIWADLLTGVPLSGPITYRPGVHYRSEERDAGALAEAVVHREWRDARKILTPRRATAHAVGPLRDPAPLLLSIRRMAAGLRHPPGAAGQR